MKSTLVVTSVLGLASFFLPWAQAQPPQTQAGATVGAISVAEQSIRVDVLATDFPAPGASSTFYAKAKAPYTLTTAAPYSGKWFLEVSLLTSPRIANGLASLAPTQVEYRAVPLLGSNVPGCTPTPGGPQSVPWSPVGTGSRAAVLEGPGICRMSIDVRLKLDGRESPGAYHADLAWTLVPASN